MLDTYLIIRDTLHPVNHNGGWPTSAARCPVDNHRLSYTNHGDVFYCSSSDGDEEHDEHVFGVTLRAVLGSAEKVCTCCTFHDY